MPARSDCSSLVYTIACDSPGSILYRCLAKLLVSSLVRSGYLGQVVVFHNSELPLFPIGRPNVREEPFDLELIDAGNSVRRKLEALEQRWALKHGVSDVLINDYEWDRLMFIDADCLVVGSIQPFFDESADLVVCREPGQSITSDQFSCFLRDDEMDELKVDGINSGIFCVNRNIATEFFKAWELAEQKNELRRRCCTDQAAFNRVVLDLNIDTVDMARFVSMPFHTDPAGKRDRIKAITHWVGCAGEAKLKASFGLFMETYFYDPSLTLFNLLEG